MTRKAHTHRGVFHPEEIIPNAYAEVIPGVSIRLFGIHNREAYDRTFRIGDEVAYDSFNMTYTGAIKSIGATGSVAVIKDRGRPQTARLDLETFNWRNRQLDLVAIDERNRDVMMSI